MPMMTVDDLAQEIRRVDGDHSIGAGALAEALLPFIERHIAEHPAAADAQGVDTEELARWCDEQSRDPDNADGAATLLVIAETLRRRNAPATGKESLQVEGVEAEQLARRLERISHHTSTSRMSRTALLAGASALRRLTASAAVKQSLTTDASAQQPAETKRADALAERVKVTDAMAIRLLTSWFQRDMSKTHASSIEAAKIALSAALKGDDDAAG